MTLPGSEQGIRFFITPDWNKLLSPGVWGDASSQIFYSLGLACGSLVALSSYNKVSFFNDTVFGMSIFFLSYLQQLIYSLKIIFILMPY